MSTEEVILETRDLDPEWYKGSKGYDPSFLGPAIPLPTIPRSRGADRAPLVGKRTYELKYTHFSLVMSKSRLLAFFTAVNIDGKNMIDLKRDPRRLVLRSAHRPAVPDGPRGLQA